MLIRQLLLIVTGTSYGLLSAAGVFTVLVAVGLIPRFAGKTHTARYVLLYEEMVIFGTLAGCFVTIFPEYSQWGNYLREHFPEQMRLWTAAGMFIGCLALAIAEMLDSIPIFARRISFRHGLGGAILGMAAGKICGSLFYFATELHRTVQ